MEAGDWFHVAVNVLIGLLLGSAAYGLLQLVISGAWLFALILVVLGLTLFGIVVLSDKLFDRLFPVWVGPVSKKKRNQPKPLLRLLSLPIGFAVGAVLAGFGLDRIILDLLP